MDIEKNFIFFDVQISFLIGKIFWVFNQDTTLSGKGLVVTEDVPKGTLLFAEKAYAIAFERADDPLPLQSLNFVTNELNNGTNVLCIIETIQKLKREPAANRQRVV
jgi:hypothetical protein